MACSLMTKEVIIKDDTIWNVEFMYATMRSASL
jgi:hypothetical protein